MTPKKAPAPVELLTPRAFGMALEVSRQAVQKAIKAGRLSASLRRDERTGRVLIELERGRAEWEAWTDPAKRHEHARAGGRPSEASRSTPSMFDPEEQQRATLVRTNLATTRTEQVQLDVERRRLELDEKRGRLIQKDEVQREAFRTARLLRDRLQAIPDRIAAPIAALESPAQVHAMLLEEITRALESLDPREAVTEES